MAEFQLTHSEREALRKLKDLARTWPKTLWLFSANGSLYVMRKKSDGHRSLTGTGGMNPAYVVEKIGGIDNDGGDW